jgi:uncharacterized DUF497 family protein
MHAPAMGWPSPEQGEPVNQLASGGSLAYNSDMKFEWDEVKSEACWRARGFDFVYAAHAFGDPNRLVQEDTRYSYGEPRHQLIGRIQTRVFVLVYTPRHGVIRIISARKANQREVKHYENRSHDH